MGTSAQNYARTSIAARAAAVFACAIFGPARPGLAAAALEVQADSAVGQQPDLGALVEAAELGGVGVHRVPVYRSRAITAR